MKRGFILLAFLILIPMISAEEIIIRIHSPSDPQTINLEEYVGRSTVYFTNYSENEVSIVIDPRNKTATITPNPNFKGVATIKISTDLTEKKEEKIQGKSLSLLPTGDYKQIEISQEELKRLMKYSVTPDLQDQLNDIPKEKIHSIYSRIEDNKLKVDINKEADFQIEFTEDKPLIKLDLKMPKTNVTLVKSVKPESKIGLYDVKDYMIPILAIFMIIMLTIFFKDKVKKLKERYLSKNRMMKQQVLRKLKEIETSPDKFLFERYIAIVRTFFSQYFKINYEFTYSELNEEIKKQVKDKSKQIFLLNLFSDISRISYSQDKIKQSEIKELISKTKKAIRIL